MERIKKIAIDMKKENVYVPIGNKKEAERAKAVLEAMGETILDDYYPFDDGHNKLAYHDGWYLTGLDFGYEHITLKQLIELLVSEQKQTEPEKIAVRVDNEKEFNALMKYYDSLGWITGATEKYTYSNVFNCYDFHDKYRRSNSVTQESLDYKIIHFSEFAKEHGIRVPLLVSEDGVELFDGDALFYVWKKSECWILLNKYTIGIEISSPEEFSNPFNKAFSTKQAALDWIEAQKPKVIEFSLNGCTNKVKVDKDYARIDCINGIGLMLQKTDVERIHKAMEDLNS